MDKNYIIFEAWQAVKRRPPPAQKIKMSELTFAATKIVAARRASAQMFSFFQAQR